MPTYYIYQAHTGEIIQRHGTHSADSGESVALLDEDLLRFVDPSLEGEHLRVPEVGAEQPDEGASGLRGVRVDVATGKLAANDE
jgi:hypothetical protein